MVSAHNQYSLHKENTMRRVPHFSRSLREVGFFADTLPTLGPKA
jgi:hypothetical protein